ncbi:hypothetical protein [Novipirellula sp.]|uniref:hypothetical protein n=1 Tax=Novipirellula sp. TaxID=2795430 RepID=UPI00356818C6
MNHLKVTLLVAAVFGVVPVVGCGGREPATVIEQPVKSDADLAKEAELYERQMRGEG